MAHEFDFLRTRWPRMAALGNDAARIADASPSVCVRTLNRYCEMAAIMAMEQLKISSIPDDTQEERLDALRTSGAPSEILQKFTNVMNAVQTQSPLGDPDLAAACVADCQDIGRWLMRQADGGVYVKPGFTGPTPPPPSVAATTIATPSELGTYNREDSSYVPGRVEMYPQDNQSATINRGRNYEESRPVYGSEMDTDEPESFLDKVKYWFTRGFGRVNWIILAAIAVVIVLIIILLSTLGKHDPGEAVPSASPTPSMTPSYTVPVATLVPTPTPTPDPATFIVYAEELQEVAAPSDFETYYKKQWTANQHTDKFQIGSLRYDHGLGMFIRSKKIPAGQGKSESGSLTYQLDGKYSQFIFDLGADPGWSYGNASKNGTFRIMVYLDDAAIDAPSYDSDFVDGTFEKKDITVDVTGVQTIRIRLMQTKGTKGTLSVVLGDARFILTEEAWQEINNPGGSASAATPAPTESTEPGASPEVTGTTAP